MPSSHRRVLRSYFWRTGSRLPVRLPLGEETSDGAVVIPVTITHRLACSSMGMDSTE